VSPAFIETVVHASALIVAECAFTEQYDGDRYQPALTAGKPPGRTAYQMLIFKPFLFDDLVGAGRNSDAEKVPPRSQVFDIF
jgi:hypothetical protein